MAADGSIIIDTRLDTSGLNSGKAQFGKQFEEIGKQAGKASKTISDSLSGGFSKSVEIAKAKVRSLEQQYAGVTAKLATAKMTDDDSGAMRMAAQQERIYDRLKAARDRLQIEVAAAAQKQATVEQTAASRQQGVISRVYSAMGAAARKAGAMVSKAFAGAKNVIAGVGRSVLALRQRFNTAGKSAGTFATRLKGIISSALVYNVLIAGLRKIIGYFGNAVKSSDEMKTALANLEGAAKTAAAPIVDAITPALVSMANAAATALSYVSRLMGSFTGKSVANMAESAKAMNKNAQASKNLSRSLAGFDEITKISTKDDEEESTEPNYSFVGQSSFLDSALSAIQSGEWETVGQLISNQITTSLNSIPWDAFQSRVAAGASGIALALNGILANPEMWNAMGTTIAEGINTVFIALGTFATTFDWVGMGASFASGLNTLVTTIDWAGAGKALSDSAKGLLASIVTAIQQIDWQQLGKSIATFIGSIDWSGLVSTLVEGIGSALAGLTLLLWGLIEDAWKAVVEWWHDVAFEDGQFTMDGLLQGVGEVFANIGKWINDNIFKPFVNGFKKLFDIHSPSKVMEEIGTFISDGLLGGFETVVEGFKAPINGVIGLINGMVGSIVNGINFAIGAINKISFDVPDWVPAIGGQTWGFNIPTLTAPKIPYLAQGAVIPPNAPFYAVLGDQRSGMNIEAPEGLLRSIFKEEMADIVGGMIAGFEAVVKNQKATQEIIRGIEIGDDTIGQAVARYNAKMAIIRGGY